MSLSTTYMRLLNTSRGDDSTTSLRSLFQCSTTLWRRNFLYWKFSLLTTVSKWICIPLTCVVKTFYTRLDNTWLQIQLFNDTHYAAGYWKHCLFLFMTVIHYLCENIWFMIYNILPGGQARLKPASVFSKSTRIYISNTIFYIGILPKYKDWIFLEKYEM